MTVIDRHPKITKGDSYMKFIPMGICGDADTAYSHMSAKAFSDSLYDGVELRTDRKSNPVIIMHCKRTAPLTWKVVYGFSEVFFRTFAEAVEFCNTRGFKLMKEQVLYCADCGAKLYQVRARDWTHEQEYFTCASYRKGEGLCSPHQIHNVQVEEILLQQLRQIMAFARAHEAEFVELVTKQNEKELARLMRDSHKELAQAKDRIRKLDAIMQRLYEDNIEGKISDERFARMSAVYDAEQKGLEARVAELETAIAEARQERLNVDSFLGMVRQYTDVAELTAEIIRSFVERIEVKQPERIPGTRAKKQTLVIWWNYIGVVDIPDWHEAQRETA